MPEIADDVHRIAVRLPLANPDAFDVDALTPVFHDWIRRGDVAEGLLIDVADYKHVPDGPGIILIGHEWDRSVDYGNGAAGVMSVAKRGLEGDLATRIRAVARDAYRTAAALARAEAVGPSAEVRTDEIEILLLDRLNAPNTPETLAAAAPAITEALAPVGGVGAPERLGDERRPFRVRVTLGSRASASERAAALS
ncbi:MAG: hypothetical protein IT200_11715 [Thermoleophilia bacterium]|nr:hypothetical protein [Thermoleophilia bacterium]